MYHPTRGGVRGGTDQFDWDDVKTDKHRESYLGHSVKAPVGRWQKGKDLHWYTRSGKGDTQLSMQQERDAVRKLEAEALAVALGKGNAKKAPTGLTKQELAEVCRKGQVERDSMDIERVEGMGFGSTRARLMDASAAPVKETLASSAEGQDREQVPLKSATSPERKSRDKKKQKKEKKEKKKPKKEKKHRKREQSDRNSSSDEKKVKRRHDHIDNTRKDSKHRRHDSTSENNSSSVESEKHSVRHRTSTDMISSRSSKHRHKDQTRKHPDNDERPRRQRHDTE